MARRIEFTEPKSVHLPLRASHSPPTTAPTPHTSQPHTTISPPLPPSHAIPPPHPGTRSQLPQPETPVNGQVTKLPRLRKLWWLPWRWLLNAGRVGRGLRCEEAPGRRWPNAQTL
ncbi:hypothetical protein M758_2G037700 [Ceratodon purpureus]|nr:hypothetical protein M758_2G037700 [Ceratodon purpureus]